ncbi:MAG: caspase family protein, partial [Myxococcota bacterium]
MLWSVIGGLAVAGAAEHERIAVVVGANQAPVGRAELRYAYDDADRVAQTLVEVGGFAKDAVTVLRDPSPRKLLDTLAQLPEAELLVFFYSGHADDQQLFPAGQSLSVAALQQALGAAPVELRVGVLDACRGGGWTGTKGLVPAATFELPDAPAQQGTVYLAASSGAEDAHEADVVAGGFFTHHWTAGLRGPADADADGRVTIDESFAYARAYT